MTRIGMLACALGLIAGAAVAQPTPSSGDSADSYFLSKLGYGSTLSHYIELLRQEFRQLDADLDGELTAADADLHQSIARAQSRAMRATAILRADLNGDGMVTANELRRALRYERRTSLGQAAASAMEAIEAEIRRLMVADIDHDDRISLAETFAVNDVRPELRNFANPQATQLRQILALASQGGTIKPADFEAAATAFFQKVDADRNGTISQDELNDFRRHEADGLRERREAAVRAECALPKASDTAKLVVLSSFKSEAISTVGLGSQEVKTGTGEIKVEPGAEPLYVVAISQEPTIWRVTGATARVERLVAVGLAADPATVLSGTPALAATRAAAEPPVQKPLAGATGIAADRVSFLARVNCLRYFSEPQSTDAAITLATIRRDAGKEPAIVVARQNVAAFSVPSGQIRSAYEDAKQPRLVIRKDIGNLTLRGDTSGVIVRTGPTDLESDLEQFSPGGVVDIDPDAVVASAPAVRYDVLPGAAGLMQLQNDGALTRNRRGEFIIHRKIRFPAGLSGLSASFLLLRGVPVPDGRPDGATVIAEETGQPVKFDRR